MLIKIEIFEFSADSRSVLAFGCPITSKCKEHCIEYGFKDGKCEGTLHTQCVCIG